MCDFPHYALCDPRRHHHREFPTSREVGYVQVTGAEGADSTLSILAVTQGQWGERIAENISANAPSDWSVQSWAAPRVIPPIVDDPEDFLPERLPRADLVIALGDVGGLAQLIPDVVRKVGAKAVIAPIDRNTALPQGLATQLKGWLEDMGVASAFPKPFCSLTETSYNRTPLVVHYEDALIARFARHFGKPEIKVDVEQGRIQATQVVRDAACGCGRYVSENLIGTPVEDALEEAGMLHHHFPCLASMNKDADYFDTLMHVSGNLLKDALKDELGAHLATIYLRPQGRVEEPQGEATNEETRL
jgi:hypothetical protein